MMKNKLLIISGLTSSGKTNLGIFLSKKLNGEIVSFDSRQAYQKLDIITGKDINKSKIKNQPSKIVIQNITFYRYQIDHIPIWLYDLYDPKEQINAYDFCQKAEIIIEDIIKRKKLPIIIGGAIFYIKSFLFGFKNHASPNWSLRKKLEKLPLEKIKKKLIEINKKRFLSMNYSDQNNKRRLIRAIEVEKAKTKLKKSEEEMKKKIYDHLFLVLVLEKEFLKKKIEARVKKRLNQGAISEVRFLLKQGYSFDDPGLKTLGYKQLKDYFFKKVSFDQAVKNWIKAEMDYGRRQLVFLKKIPGIVLVNPKEKNFLEKIKKLVYKWLYDSKN